MAWPTSPLPFTVAFERNLGVNQPAMGSWAPMSTAAATRRALAPLAIVTVAAFLFALLLILVRFQWAPLESVDHHAAAGLNRLVAGDAAVVGVIKAITWLGSSGVLWTVTGTAAVVLAIRRRGRLAGSLPGGGGPGWHARRPGLEGAGRRAAPGGRGSDRVRDRQQLPERARARVDRLLRRPLPCLSSRRPRQGAPRVHRVDRRADRRRRRPPAS